MFNLPAAFFRYFTAEADHRLIWPIMNKAHCFV